jgi:hypothetical protein
VSAKGSANESVVPHKDVVFEDGSGRQALAKAQQVQWYWHHAVVVEQSGWCLRVSEKSLSCEGVIIELQAQGSNNNLTLGFHILSFAAAPADRSRTPSQTEIIVSAAATSRLSASGSTFQQLPPT